jgi:hypothetical protein
MQMLSKKQYRDMRDLKFIGMAGAVAVIIMGLWMILNPNYKDTAPAAPVTVAALEMLWGTWAGIILVMLGLIWLAFGIKSYKRFKASFQVSESPSQNIPSKPQQS